MIDHRVTGDLTLGAAISMACELVAKRWPRPADYEAWWRGDLERHVTGWEDPRLADALVRVATERAARPGDAPPPPHDIANSAWQSVFLVNETSISYEPLTPDERRDSAAKLRAYRQRHGMT